MDFDLSENMALRTDAFTDSVFHLAVLEKGKEAGSALDRYGFVRSEWPESGPAISQENGSCTLKTQKASLSVTGQGGPDFTFRDNSGVVLLRGRANRRSDGGFEVEIDLEKNEKIFGLGDQNRDRIEHRGTIARMWIRNVITYIPIPMAMSSRGYGLFLNTTWRHAWDVGKSDPDKLKIVIPEGNLDLYIIYGPSLKEILENYTEITGKPCLPPKWSFGLWYICNSYADHFEVANTAVNFRDRKIPCDVIGLEPGWMETEYDYSINKKWHPDRFPRVAGANGFLAALKRMNFRLMLWLCMDYDLSYESEKRIGNDLTVEKEEPAVFHEDDVEKDAHFLRPRRMDKLTKPEEAWFEHLKKFVDQGAELFKQDGSDQVMAHPDRLWGNKMSDLEMHNLYPLLYSQQMFDGFKEHTGKRPCCFTPDGWAGLQRYTGTWTGDTGGGARTLAACLNLALCGHGLNTCDMDVSTKESIHYGFLLPWAQVNSFAYFRNPWMLGDDLYPVFLEYAQLRSRLVPYLYTCAWNAHRTGIPLMRPMVLECQDDEEAAGVLNEFFLGREMLVTAFDRNVYLPEGKWYDYWTGKAYVGPTTFDYQPPERRGGGLFVRADSIIPLGPVVDYVGQKTSEGFTVKLFLEEGGKASFSLYDDDGVSFNYEKGEFKLYQFKAVSGPKGLAVELPPGIKVDKLESYLDKKPDSVTVNGKQCAFTWCDEDGRLEVVQEEGMSG